jgi:four helix bundle protein
LEEQVSYQFEKLIAWQEAKELTKAIYKLLVKFPRQEDYVLCDQIRRAAISVPSNIAEQSGRTSLKEKIHFLEIAYGSLMEVYCQLQIACELNYITTNELETIKPMIFKTSRLISGLRNNYVKKAELPKP